MTVLPAQLIRHAMPVSPLVERSVIRGRSYGLSCCGYDVRIREDRIMWPGRFCLASTIERFDMPDDMMGIVHDKSSWARLGIAAQNTVVEPQWKGYLTLELTNHSWRVVRIRAGDPIVQIVFHRLEAPTGQPYSGKYQDQPPRPVGALKEVAQ